MLTGATLPLWVSAAGAEGATLGVEMVGASRPTSLEFGRTQRNQGKMSDEDMKAELDRLRRENEALKQGAKRGVSLKVSEKGGLSVYGLGRFPITLYQEQWTKLLDMSDQIRAFIAEHQGELKKKE